MSKDLWIEAGKILAVDPRTIIKCPDCGEAELTVLDTPADATHIDRHIRCPGCGAYNALYKNIGFDHP
ncbi:hypothetical protein [Mesorhizobium loti]|uniref:Transcription factor zinc-finger domain-containing protein n=1 Tax=Mesorhizobium loti R88b TaxID=935548 RepID=A0A6M7WKN0_RHILI|nr:hypothetical protein [Mesorhizobium loti]QKD04550.1 hypothetical protein EB235_26210 [Mesorhizobium loti R88b]